MTTARPRSFFVLKELRQKAEVVPWSIDPKTGDKVSTLRVFLLVRDGYGQTYALPSLLPDPSEELQEMARDLRVPAKVVKRRWKAGALLRADQEDNAELRLCLQAIANDIAGLMDAVAARGLAIEIVARTKPPVDGAPPVPPVGDATHGDPDAPLH